MKTDVWNFKKMKKLDCTQRQHTFANAKCTWPLPQPKVIRIRIQISGLQRIRVYIHRIAPERYLVYSLVGVSQFVENCKKRPETAWDMPINFLKLNIFQRWRKWKSDPYRGRGHHSPAKVDQFFPLIGPITAPSFSK